MQGHLLNGMVKTFARSQNGLGFLSLEKLMRKIQIRKTNANFELLDFIRK